MQNDSYTFRLNDRVRFNQEYMDMISGLDATIESDEFEATRRAVGTIIDANPRWTGDSRPRFMVSWDPESNNRFFAGETVVLSGFLELV